MRLNKSRILLTIPTSLLDDADEAAHEHRVSRGEFIRAAIAKSLNEARMLDRQVEELGPMVVQRTANWSVKGRRL